MAWTHGELGRPCSHPLASWGLEPMTSRTRFPVASSVTSEARVPQLAALCCPDGWGTQEDGGVSSLGGFPGVQPFSFCSAGLGVTASMPTASAHHLPENGPCPCLTLSRTCGRSQGPGAQKPRTAWSCSVCGWAAVFLSYVYLRTLKGAPAQ